MALATIEKEKIKWSFYELAMPTGYSLQGHEFRRLLCGGQPQQFRGVTFSEGKNVTSSNQDSEREFQSAMIFHGRLLAVSQGPHSVAKP